MYVSFVTCFRNYIYFKKVLVAKPILLTSCLEKKRSYGEVQTTPINALKLQKQTKG